MLNIVKNKKMSFTFSGILFIISVFLIFSIGLKPGIDFTGGSLLELRFTGSRPINAEIQDVVNALNFGEVTVQPVGEDGILLKMRFITEQEHQTLLENIRSKFGVISVLPDKNVTSLNLINAKQDQDNIQLIENTVLEERIETIGPAISTYLRSRAWKATLVVIIAIILFIAYAFRRVSKPIQSWKYGISAIIALIHDITITMGFFVLFGKYLGVEVNISFIVALLTILGYSVNDTIVVFDRIRENLIERGAEKFDETVNLGVNQTLVRSLNTSITTLLVLVALFLYGGESIKFFSLALIIGVGFGTYSSIFLASPLLVVWQSIKLKR